MSSYILYAVKLRSDGAAFFETLATRLGSEEISPEPSEITSASIADLISLKTAVDVENISLV